MAPALADNPREIILGIAKLLDELVVSLGFLDWIEVGSLDVFDNGKFKRLLVGRLEHDDRHFVQASALGGPPPALAGDDLESVSQIWHAADHDGLNQPSFTNGVRQLCELGIVE